MPEITKSGAKLHLFIVTHKYTDLYFIFFFQQPTPGRQANLGLRLYNRLSAVASHIVRHHPSYCASTSSAIHRFAPSAQYIAIGVTPSARSDSGGRMGHRPPSIYMRFGDALLRRPRERSRLQLTPDRVGGTRTDAYAPRSAAAERSIAKCRKLGRR